MQQLWSVPDYRMNHVIAHYLHIFWHFHIAKYYYYYFGQMNSAPHIHNIYTHKINDLCNMPLMNLNLHFSVRTAYANRPLKSRQ